MRITNNMLTSSFLADMQTNLQNMQKLQQQMTSGKLISKPSDDPVIAARSMELNSQINANTQYNSNINGTQNWLSTTDTTLGQLSSSLSRINTLLISTGAPGYSQDEKQSIKDEINQIISGLSQTLNTNFDGKYLFGGTRGTDKPTMASTVTTTTVTAGATATTVGGITTYSGGTITTKIQEPDLKVSQPILSQDVKTVPGAPATTTTTINLAAGATGLISSNGSTLTITDASGATTTVTIPAGATVTTNAGVTPIATSPALPTGTDGEITITDSSAPALTSSITSKDVFTDSTGTTTTITQPNTSLPNGTVTTTNTKLEYSRSDGTVLDTNAAAGSQDATELNMIGRNLTTEISQGVTVDYSVPATNVMKYTDSTTGAAADLRNLLQSIVNHLDGKNADGSTVTSTDPDPSSLLTTTDLQGITDATNNILSLRSKVGAIENRMKDAQDNNQAQNQNLTTILSKTEDIDITQKTMEYATAQTVYMASLQTGAKVIQPSLLDYLK